MFFQNPKKQIATQKLLSLFVGLFVFPSRNSCLVSYNDLVIGVRQAPLLAILSLTEGLRPEYPWLCFLNYFEPVS